MVPSVLLLKIVLPDKCMNKTKSGSKNFNNKINMKRKSKTKIHFLENKRVYLPKGVSTETWPSGEQRFVVTWQEHGKKKKKSFPWTQGGLDEAKALNETLKKEVKKYGAEFGNITTDEKVALDYIRQYIKEAQSNGFAHSLASEIVKDGLQKRKTTSLPFTELARLYFNNELMRETDGVLTEYAETVSKRLFNHICPVFRNKPAHTITKEEVLDFLNALKGKNGNRASAETRRQYLIIIKKVFSYAIQEGIHPDAYNPVAKLFVPKPSRKQEPEILTVDEVKTIFSFVKSNPKYHEFIPILAVGFFCGPRLNERIKMTYRDIFVGGRNEIYIPSENAKTGNARYIYPTKNFKKWMEYAKRQGISMSPNNFLLDGNSVKQRRDTHSKFLVALSKETGIKLPKNCIRHTAASFMAESLGWTKSANQLGHGINILTKHYRHAVTETEAEDYFNITPDAV